MSLEELIKEATRSFAAQLHEALEGMAEDLSRAAADERESAINRATETLRQQLAEAQAGAKADLDRAVADEVARAREEIEEAAIARIEAVRAEARQTTEAAVAQARSEARESLELERARAEAASERAAETSVGTAVAGERDGLLARIERLLAVVRKLDAAESLTEILTTLADGAAAEAPRVAILTLHGDRVRGWRFTGFAPEPQNVDLDAHQAGVIGRALRDGRSASAEPAAPGQTQPPGPGFAELPPDRSGLAVPLLVGGSAVAVLYADDASEEQQMKPAPWPEAVELLARHAAVRLENLTAVRTAQAFGMSSRPRESAPNAAGAAAGGSSDEDEGGARRYARLLVSEIKLYNESAVRVGRQKRDLFERLRAEIDRARRLYEERVPAAVRARRGYFDEELVQTLADGDASLLGRQDALA